ncbi:MAG: MmcQ/YjbR family DNA-binding protein [Bryobacteraceae bacterium]
MTFESIRKMAMALDNVEEGTSYGTPAFKVGGALFARLRDDLGALVVRMSIEDRQELMAADPETYFITDHYLQYPWILVRLSRVKPDAMRDLLRGAWKSANRTE